MSISKPSSRDTKSTILKKYENLYKEYKELEKKYKDAASSSAPAPRRAAPAPASAPKARIADSSIGGVIASLSALKDSFGDATGTLSGKLRTEALKLAALGDEIEEITQHLVNLHEIEVADDPDETLAEIIQEYETKSEEFDEELANKRDASDAEMNETRKNWEREQQEHAARTKERDSELRLARRRENAEFQYDLEKQRRAIADEDAQTKKERKRVLTEMRDVKSTAWAEREQEVAEREEEHAEYHEKAEALEEELEAAIKKAKDSGAGIARQQAKVKGDLIAAQIDADKRTFDLMIQSRESTISDNARQIEALTQQINSFVHQTKEIADKALQGPEQSASFEALREIALKQAGGLSKK